MPSGKRRKGERCKVCQEWRPDSEKARRNACLGRAALFQTADYAFGYQITEDYEVIAVAAHRGYLSQRRKGRKGHRRQRLPEVIHYWLYVIRYTKRGEGGRVQRLRRSPRQCGTKAEDLPCRQTPARR